MVDWVVDWVAGMVAVGMVAADTTVAVDTIVDMEMDIVVGNLAGEMEVVGDIRRVEVDIGTFGEDIVAGKLPENWVELRMILAVSIHVVLFCLFRDLPDNPWSLFVLVMNVCGHNLCDHIDLCDGADAGLYDRIDLCDKVDVDLCDRIEVYLGDRGNVVDKVGKRILGDEGVVRVTCIVGLFPTID